MAIKTDTYTSKYSDSQKTKFAVDETKVTTLLGRNINSISTVRDYLFGNYPNSYIEICNKFFGGSVKVVG